MVYFDWFGGGWSVFSFGRSLWKTAHFDLLKSLLSCLIKYDISQVDVFPIGSYVKRDYGNTSVNLQNTSFEWDLIEREKN